MRAGEIISALERFAPLSIQEKWDNSGLQIGSPDDEVTGVMVGFDCTPQLVRMAAENGCNMIVTHHPLLFGGLKKICPEDPTGRTVIDAVKAGMVVYAAHTTADKVMDGVSGAMARRLGLQNIRILDDEGGEIGLGAVGELPEPMAAADVLDLVKKAFGLKMIRTSRLVGCPVRTVAMCGGSGSSLIGSAMAAGAQLYLCGDISYHHFFTPEGFMVADIGHFESEVEIVDVISSYLRKNFPNFAVRVCPDVRESNPVNYL